MFYVQEYNDKGGNWIDRIGSTDFAVCVQRMAYSEKHGIKARVIQRIDIVMPVSIGIFNPNL